MDVDIDSARRLRAVDDHQAARLMRAICDARDRQAETGRVGHVTNADDARVAHDRFVEQRDDSVGVVRRYRQLHLVDRDAGSSSKVLPAREAAAVLVVGRKDAVAPLQVDAGGDQVHAFGRVAGDGDFVGVTAEQISRQRAGAVGFAEHRPEPEVHWVALEAIHRVLHRIDDRPG